MSFWRRWTEEQPPQRPFSSVCSSAGCSCPRASRSSSTPTRFGVGRFVKIGIPAAAVMAPFVGIVEIAGGTLLVAGLVTRLATVPLIIDMLVAIATTKIPFFLKNGFWATAHEARVDYAVLLGSIFLLLVGAGPVSLDARLRSSRPKG